MLFRLLASFVSGVLLASSPIKAEPLEPARFAYITEGISPLNIRDIRLGYDFLIKRYAKHYNMGITMFYDPEGITAANQFQKGDVQYIGMSYILAAQLFSTLEPSLGDIYLSSRGDAMLEQQIALIRNDAPNSLNYFMKKKAVIQEGASNSIMHADMLSMEKLHKRYYDSFNIEYTDNPNRAILKLFFNQSDIAFVTLRSWETAKAMNPALAKQLKILHISQPIYGYGIEIFSNKISPRLQTVSKKANDDLQQTEDGRQLLRIMKATKREKTTKEELKIYLEPYVRYLAQLKAFKGNQ